MTTREKIEQAIDDRWALTSGDKREAQAVKDAIFALPGFAPEREREWPDAEGVWVRFGELHIVEHRKNIYGHTVFVPVNGLTNERWPHNKELGGHWLPVTLLIPPPLPAEAATERLVPTCADIRGDSYECPKCKCGRWRSSSAMASPTHPLRAIYLSRYISGGVSAV